MKARMFRKALNVNDWQEQVTNYNTRESDVVIEKIVVLNSDEFNFFCANFMSDQEYITKNVDLMYLCDGKWHCILVKSCDSEIGVLVESEGYDYARYTAVVNLNDIDINIKKYKYYFTYGTCSEYPFVQGHVLVVAGNISSAVALYRAKYPDITEGVINCCSIYEEHEFSNCEYPSMLIEHDKIEEII